MDKDLVSVIMPAYNAAAYIAESIASVIGQTYPHWELIVVDDGSTDDTAAIVEQYQKTDARIKYLHQQNGRQGKARNLGIKNSRGKYIAFLDADDKWIADKLSIQTKTLQADDNIDLIFSRGYHIIESHLTDMDVDVREIWNHDNFADFVLHNRIPILSVLAKKEALEQAGGFSEKDGIQNAEDYHLWLKLLLHHKNFKSIPERLFYYRVHPGQSTYQAEKLTAPIFYTYQDLFYAHPEYMAREILINKLKWYIFNPGFHQQCLAIIISHLNHRRKAMIGFVIEKLFSKPAPFSQKMVFRLVSAFG